MVMTCDGDEANTANLSQTEKWKSNRISFDSPTGGRNAMKRLSAQSLMTSKLPANISEPRVAPAIIVRYCYVADLEACARNL